MIVGDVVTLRGSFTKMTVVSVNGDQVICNWFEESEFKKREFEMCSLHVIESDEFTSNHSLYSELINGVYRRNGRFGLNRLLFILDVLEEFKIKVPENEN